MERYALGVDFGTGSVRASAVSLRDGSEAATQVCEYRVIEGELACGVPLKPRMALADPQEYLEAMTSAIRALARETPGVCRGIAAMAVDATSCTLVPTDAAGKPMCAYARWAREPQAYAKLWKSHSAGEEAERIAECGAREGMAFMERCGHRPSSEWLYPKALETLRDVPALYQETAFFVDMPDWITWMLTGRLTRGNGAFAIKGFRGEDGLPPAAFWRKVDPTLEGVNGKLAGEALHWGEPVGKLLPRMAERLGLPEDVLVAASSLDGHVPMVALGLHEDGDLMLSIGTSNVFALISKRWVPLPGICSAAKDAFVPGFYGYDAGQAAVGDMFGWFIENCLPAAYDRQAREAGESPHALLSRLGFAKPITPDGPLAVDWWNGNRSPLCRFDLTGTISGLTLQTRPEDIYRALVEATGFGARRIIDNFERHGVSVGRIYVCGGIARKNSYVVQCYADILDRPLRVSTLSNAACVGAAITAAAALRGPGKLFETMDALRATDYTRYAPSPERATAYDGQYRRYLALSDAALRMKEEV